jgi:anti-anti-sigma factor
LFQENALVVFNSELTDIEVDLSETLLLDCAGQGVLLALDRVCRDRDGAVRLRNPSPPADQILDLTRMERVMEIVKDGR